MRPIAITLLIILFGSLGFGQNPTREAQPIVAEGKILYKSEMASWYGTDLFLESYKNRENIGGYFSYNEDQTSTCIFFSKANPPKVIGTILFDSTFKTETAILSLTERDFNRKESDLYQIRAIALAEINSDSLFKSYKNTNLNLIPLINEQTKKVYVLTGPQQSGVIIIGNDYLLEFDNDNKLLTKKRLHKSLIPIYYGEKEAEGAMHTHLPETGDFITATDICTLMLYAKFAKWKTHNVVSKKYLNVWNCETNQLTVISMEAVDKINKDQKERKKGKKKN